MHEYCILKPKTFFKITGDFNTPVIPSKLFINISGN
jgi:hypothetical protein